MKQLDFSLLEGVDSKGERIRCANIEETADAAAAMSEAEAAATKMQAIERGRQSRRKSAAMTGSKAKKMGSLLLKAHNEGNLEAAVDDMEKAGVA